MLTPDGMKISRSALALAGWVALSFVAAGVGARFTPGDWYAGLNKPAWNPPNAVFAPVWTALYILMAVAAWLVWKRGGWKAQRWALSFYVVQLALNALWSPLFFGLHEPGLAFAELVLLWVTLLGTVIAFWNQQRLAGALLVPYLLWVTFAAALNFEVWRLNS